MVLPTGEAAVGKSSLVLRFVQNDFNENTSPTIGAAFLTQSEYHKVLLRHVVRTAVRKAAVCEMSVSSIHLLLCVHWLAPWLFLASYDARERLGVE